MNLWGRRVLAIAGALKMNTLQVSEVLGVSRYEVQRWIAGTRVPGPVSREKIKEAERKYAIRPEKNDER